MPTFQLDHKTRSLVFKKDTIIKNDLIYSFFDKIPQDERLTTFQKALYIGVLALLEDRLSAFFAKTSDELGAQLEHLKMLFDLQTEVFSKTAVKGKYTEQYLVKVLNDYFNRKHWKDYAILIGDTAGKYKNNKTGDILCFVDGDDNNKIVIEVKATNISLGDISQRNLSSTSDNIWGQLVEAQANRDAQASIIALDKTFLNTSLINELEIVHYLPNIGFVALVDNQKGDYLGLYLAYNLARSTIYGDFPYYDNKKLLTKIINKVITEITQILKIRTLIEKNIKNNQKILDSLESSLQELSLTKEYTHKLLSNQNNLNPHTLFKFLTGQPSSKQ